ncbi:MAG TPA: gephyrin-like molybdotransferase Glp [Acidobacteriota bacterium]|nr:gephyrin-like molybdotransferase Glp [Acidobacteriota bacterium]
MTEFFHVITADEFIRKLERFGRLGHETAPLDQAINRVLSRDIIAAEDLPEGARSTVDGFAVRAADTFGASDALPAFLEIAASVPMGAVPDFELRPGQAARIATGGFLPEGADAVVMVEYTNPAGRAGIEVTRPVTLKNNVLEKGEDAGAGTTLVPTGKELRPQEIGFLAAMGMTELPVYRKPRVAVISSGDEVVPVEARPLPGRIRDANSHAIAALVRSTGAEPVLYGIVPDNAEMLRAALQKAVSETDVATLSGGSSVGTRDLMVEVIAGIREAEIIAHGISIRPGKPTLLAGWKGKAIIGLPGHPVSALTIAQIFLAPFLRYLQGGKLGKGPLGSGTVQAQLATSIHSTIGLEEYIRVRLEETAEGIHVAHPVFGKSGMLSTMVKADGIISIPMNAEGFSKGKSVQVTRY